MVSFYHSYCHIVIHHPPSPPASHLSLCFGRALTPQAVIHCNLAHQAHHITINSPPLAACSPSTRLASSQPNLSSPLPTPYRYHGVQHGAPGTFILGSATPSHAILPRSLPHCIPVAHPSGGASCPRSIHQHSQPSHRPQEGESHDLTPISVWRMRLPSPCLVANRASRRH